MNLERGGGLLTGGTSGVRWTYQREEDDSLRLRRSLTPRRRDLSTDWRERSDSGGARAST
ncbi:hypothetical protein PybrP1_003768 [[Pythium] brassicae (nom. inval.)]|nr:hypothetical protein PybrP1_003768 [[Pythium] brassicae (nom. inval.)]